MPLPRSARPLPSLFVLVSLLVACSEGTAHFNAKAGNAALDAGSRSRGPASASEPKPATASEPEPTSAKPAPADAKFGVRFVGRVDASDPAGARFAWSGTGLVARFSGTSIAAKFSAGQQYTVVIDGEVTPKWVPTGGEDTIAEGLDDGEHVIEIYRRTEANQGDAVFMELVPDGKLLDPPAAPARRIEIIGDSITCGYGDEGADMNCSFSADTENHYLTYGAVAARKLDAELSTIAWSGKGVVCNYGDGASSCVDPLPEYYDRTLPNRSTSMWDFSKWQADAVVINLGTNDMSTAEDPSEDEFESAYVALLERIRNAYPDAYILCTNGPMLSGADLASVRSYIDNAVHTRVAAGDHRVGTFQLQTEDGSNGYGCDWHPSVATHAQMADTLVAALQDALGW
jgi:lysophospholipase L1-like esterase